MFWYMQGKEVGKVDALPNIIRGKRYHIMSLKVPKYIVFMMTTYGTLDNLEGSDTQRRYKGSGG